MITKCFTYLLKWYKPLSLVIVAGWLIAIYLAATQLKVNNEISIWFLDGDPDYKAYLDFQHNYGSDDWITVMMEPDTSVFQPSGLRQLMTADSALNELNFVDRVWSLASSTYFFPTIALYREAPVLDEQLRKKPDADKIKRRLEKAHFGVEWFVSPDEKFAYLYIQLKPLQKIENERDVMVRKIRTLLDEQGISYHLAGMAVLNEALNTTVIEETGLFSILSILVITVILVVYFRHFNFALLTLIAVMVPIGYMYAIFVLTGHQLNMISMIIPTILMVYCVADSIHIINRFQYLANLPDRGGKEEVILQTLHYSLKPCFYTSATTLAGYIGFSFSPLYALKETGWFAALGIGLSFVLTFLIIGIGLMYLKMPEANKERAARNYLRKKMEAYALHLPAFLGRHKNLTIATSIAIIATACFIIPFLEVNTFPMEYLDKNNIARKDSEAIEKALGAYLPFELLIRSKTDSSLISRERLRAIEAFQATLVRDSIIVAPYSMATVVKRLKRAMAGNPFITFTLLDDQNIEKRLHAFQKENRHRLRAFANEDFTEFRINSKVKMLSAQEFKQLVEKVSTQFSSIIPSGLQMELIPQGYIPLYVKMISYLTKSQLRSFLFAFLLAGVFMLICFRRVRIVILSFIPNLLPLAIVAITMFAFGISLDSGTVMIAAIILGMAVDDTIHFLHAYLYNADRNMTHNNRLTKAVSTTGLAMLVSSFALICGFGIIGLSALKSLQIFGGLCALAILFAFIADLFVLPAFLSGWINKGDGKGIVGEQHIQENKEA